MNVFIVIAALMTLLVVAWLAYPLFRLKTSSGISSERINVEIHRDQLKALETDLARGIISQQDFEASRDELQLRLLDDTQSYEAPRNAKTAHSFLTTRLTSIIISLSIPILAIGLYKQLGNPAAINPLPGGAQMAADPQIQKMVDSLIAKLKANPDNPKGWAMLARSYVVMGKLDEAEKTFLKMGDAINTDADILVEFADLLAVKNNNNIEGRPIEMVRKALTINPHHPMGLMMSGVAAYRRADFKMAAAEWEKLLAILEPGSPDAQQIEANVNDARAKAGMPPISNANAPAAANVAQTPAATPVTGNDVANTALVNQMVERLANRLKDNPDDVAGWARLAHAYKVQGKLKEAEQAYSKTGQLLETDTEVMLQYADLLAMNANGKFAGRSIALIDKVLKIDAKNPMALMMAGQAAYQAADYAKAIGHWETVLTVLPPQSPDVELVRGEIASAKAKL